MGTGFRFQSLGFSVYGLVYSNYLRFRLLKLYFLRLSFSVPAHVCLFLLTLRPWRTMPQGKCVRQQGGRIPAFLSLSSTPTPAGRCPNQRAHVRHASTRCPLLAVQRWQAKVRVRGRSKSPRQGLCAQWPAATPRQGLCAQWPAGGAARGQLQHPRRRDGLLDDARASVRHGQRRRRRGGCAGGAEH